MYKNTPHTADNEGRGWLEHLTGCMRRAQLFTMHMLFLYLHVYMYMYMYMYMVYVYTYVHVYSVLYIHVAQKTNYP